MIIDRDKQWFVKCGNYLYTYSEIEEYTPGDKIAVSLKNGFIFSGTLIHVYENGITFGSDFLGLRYTIWFDDIFSIKKLDNI